MSTMLCVDARLTSNEGKNGADVDLYPAATLLLTRLLSVSLVGLVSVSISKTKLPSTHRCLYVRRVPNVSSRHGRRELGLVFSEMFFSVRFAHLRGRLGCFSLQNGTLPMIEICDLDQVSN